MIPRIKIRMHQRYGSGDEKEGAVKQCRHFLLDSYQTSEGESTRSKAFQESKERILAQDKNKVLEGFKIPTRIYCQPRKYYCTEDLCEYLQDVVDVAKGMQARRQSSQADYPFVLEHVEIILRTEFLDDTLDLLKQLLPLGVPVSLHSDGTAWVIDPDERIRFMTLFASDHDVSRLVAPAAHSFHLSGYVADHFIALMSAVATSDR